MFQIANTKDYPLMRDFQASEIAAMQRFASELNGQRDGDSAAFVLAKRDDMTQPFGRDQDASDISYRRRPPSRTRPSAAACIQS